MRPILLLLLPLGLAACAPEPPLAQGALPARADTAFTVRTMAAAPSGVNLEVTGVDCRAEAPGLDVAFRTPARVAVPVAGAQAQPVRVRCQGGGRAGEAYAQPRADWGGAGGITAWPSVGIGVSSGGNVGVGVGINTWPSYPAGPARIRYDDVRVVLQ